MEVLVLPVNPSSKAPIMDPTISGPVDGAIIDYAIQIWTSVRVAEVFKHHL